MPGQYGNDRQVSFVVTYHSSQACMYKERVGFIICHPNRVVTDRAILAIPLQIRDTYVVVRPSAPDTAPTSRTLFRGH